MRRKIKQGNRVESGGIGVDDFPIGRGVLRFRQGGQGDVSQQVACGPGL